MAITTKEKVSMSPPFLPKKYNKSDIEDKWRISWENDEIYLYDENTPKKDTFIVDTPPPTVSGNLHMGHVFSYTQTDVIVRYQRMNGKNIFYPIGWDNNGLPTERRVQNLHNITCNPTLPYKPNGLEELDKEKSSNPIPVSSRNFIEICQLQTELDQKKYRELWKRIGLSFDWRYEYTTIDNHAIKTSQYSFLDLAKNNFIESKILPTMWDTTYQTAVALAEIEEKEEITHYYDIEFRTEENDPIVISTTRPELLAACIAITVNPDDKRYLHLIGKKAITPLFYAEVPIIASNTVIPEKGTGIMMICTFGDGNDVLFWKQHNLPLKQIIGKKGLILPNSFGKAPFESTKPTPANDNYAELISLTIKNARKKVVALLGKSNSNVNNDSVALIKSTNSLHNVKIYEKGELPIEYIPTRQWFIKLLPYVNELLEQGQKIKWHPSSMLTRYEQWVKGLDQDWCISRQRFFGVPFPVWYPLDKEGEILYNNPIYADENTLPMDPQTAIPPGYHESQRNQTGGFIAEPDVMDTWATSSLTPQLTSQWPNQHSKLYPATLRTQAHEIIRTWAFYTIVKSWFHERSIPWENIAISGWVVNPDNSKMSKSTGKSITPEGILDNYSADAVRYWAAKAKLGHDTVFDENTFQIGQRLAIKLFNASKFVVLQLDENNSDLLAFLDTPNIVTQSLDKAWISKLATLIKDSTEAFERFDYAQALTLIESLFWVFCDDYLELVKARAYQEKDKPTGKSAIATLLVSIRIFLRLFAPTMPFITEEIWSWLFSAISNNKSIHISSWPKIQELHNIHYDDGELFDIASTVLKHSRSEKSKFQRNMKWPIKLLKITAPKKTLELLQTAEIDLRNSCYFPEDGLILQTTPSDQFIIDVKLSENEQSIIV